MFLISRMYRYRNQENNAIKAILGAQYELNQIAQVICGIPYPAIQGDISKEKCFNASPSTLLKC